MLMGIAENTYNDVLKQLPMKTYGRLRRGMNRKSSELLIND